MAETLVRKTRAGRGTRIGIQRELPRVYLALASHGGSCKHRRGDQRSQQKFNLGHFIFSIEYEKPTALGRVAGLASGAPCGLASHRVDKIALLFRINQETGEVIGLFRRTSLVGQASVSTI